MNLRGLMTSLGAGGSLIAAALCAFVLVGGLLAFRGVVDDPAEARGGDVTLPGARPSSAASTPDPPPAAGAAPAPSIAEPRAQPRRRATRLVASPPRRRATRPVASPPASTVPETSGERAGGGTEQAPPPATRERPRTVARVVERTRETAAPVVEAAPEPVRPVVDQVVDVVEDVAGTVDETLAPVTGLLEREL